eukprot:m.5149 g.5149  ORF g.5149 m.5149 type:complete len:118 (+) comp5328_c0_seq1:292-645(+)
MFWDFSEDDPYFVPIRQKASKMAPTGEIAQNSSFTSQSAMCLDNSHSSPASAPPVPDRPSPNISTQQGADVTSGKNHLPRIHLDNPAQETPCQCATSLIIMEMAGSPQLIFCFVVEM